MDEKEFTNKVMVYSSKFYGYSYKILGNQEEALDVVQDLYVKLWEIKGRLDSIYNIEAFATTIIRNLCIDRLKRQKTAINYKDDYNKQTVANESNSDESKLADQEEKLELVRSLVNKLPELQQKVFIMRDIEEKTFDLISIELGITPENVRVVLSRARKKIRELIENSLI